MRWLSLLGAIVFAYLAITPAGLIFSTVDSACAGGDCQTPLAQDILLVALYAFCLAGIAGTSVLLGMYFFRQSAERERLIRKTLVGALAAVGTTLFALFALAYPIAALFTLGVGGMVFGTLTYLNGPKRKPPPVEPSSNGHGKLNGHPG